jgi:hypothetical protein
MFPNLNLNIYKLSIFKLSLSSLPLKSNKNKLITSFSKFEPTSLGLSNSTQGEFCLSGPLKANNRLSYFSFWFFTYRYVMLVLFLS